MIGNRERSMKMKTIRKFQFYKHITHSDRLGLMCTIVLDLLCFCWFNQVYTYREEIEKWFNLSRNEPQNEKYENWKLKNVSKSRHSNEEKKISKKEKMKKLFVECFCCYIFSPSCQFLGSFDALEFFVLSMLKAWISRT